jgi:hypothetical protein
LRENVRTFRRFGDGSIKFLGKNNGVYNNKCICNYKKLGMIMDNAIKSHYPCNKLFKTNIGEG